MSAKSQFLATNNSFNGGDNLLGSLTLAVTDTRGGFDAPTAQLVGELKGYAEANSNGQRFGAYMDKITPATKTTVAPRATVKPGNGMM